MIIWRILLLKEMPANWSHFFTVKRVFSPKYLDLVTGVFEINSEIRESHFFYRKKDLDERYSKIR